MPQPRLSIFWIVLMETSYYLKALLRKAMFPMPSPHLPSIAVRRALTKLGSDLREARLRRSLPADVIASRAFTTRPTLRRIEAGDPGVGIGIYAAVLQAMGMLDGLGMLADPASDKAGLLLSAEALPERARIKRRKASGQDDG